MIVMLLEATFLGQVLEKGVAVNRVTMRAETWNRLRISAMSDTGEAFTVVQTLPPGDAVDPAPIAEKFQKVVFNVVELINDKGVTRVKISGVSRVSGKEVKSHDK